MRVLMIAPPGAGKGTQGALIAAHFDILHIATGELLRDHVARQSALGMAVQKYLDRGELVPNQVVLDMVREALVAARAAGGGFVLDGIPRNMQQARALYLIGRELGMIADVALHLQAGDEGFLVACSREPRSSIAPTTPQTSLPSAFLSITKSHRPLSRGTATAESWFPWMQCAPRLRSAAKSLPRWRRCRPFLDQVPGQARLSVDLTSLGDAFGATDSAAGPRRSGRSRRPRR